MKFDDETNKKNSEISYMNCPFCGEDITGITWGQWNLSNDNKFKIICPGCANTVSIVVEIDLNSELTEDTP